MAPETLSQVGGVEQRLAVGRVSGLALGFAQVSEKVAAQQVVDLVLGVEQLQGELEPAGGLIGAELGQGLPTGLPGVDDGGGHLVRPAPVIGQLG